MANKQVSSVLKTKFQKLFADVHDVPNEPDTAARNRTTQSTELRDNQMFTEVCFSILAPLKSVFSFGIHRLQR